MEVNTYNDLNISNVTAETKSITSTSHSSSLFNTLIAHNNDISQQDENASKIKDLASLFNELKDEISISASDSSNTHEELTLILELKKQYAS